MCEKWILAHICYAFGFAPKTGCDTRGAVSLLKKAGCEHAKVVIQPDFIVSAEDVKDPSTEAISLGRKFYSIDWLNGGKEIADEAIRQTEEEVISNSEPLFLASATYCLFLFYSYTFFQAHQAKEEAKKAEEVAELERRIGICFC